MVNRSEEYLHNAIEVLNSGPSRTYSESRRANDFSQQPPGFKSSVISRLATWPKTSPLKKLYNSPYHCSPESLSDVIFIRFVSTTRNHINFCVPCCITLRIKDETTTYVFEYIHLVTFPRSLNSDTANFQFSPPPQKTESLFNKTRSEDSSNFQGIDNISVFIFLGTLTRSSDVTT